VFHHLRGNAHGGEVRHHLLGRQVADEALALAIAGEGGDGRRQARLLEEQLDRRDVALLRRDGDASERGRAVGEPGAVCGLESLDRGLGVVGGRVVVGDEGNDVAYPLP